MEDGKSLGEEEEGKAEGCSSSSSTTALVREQDENFLGEQVGGERTELWDLRFL